MVEIEQGRHGDLVKSEKEIELMRVAGRHLAAIRDEIAGMIRPGLRLIDLDRTAQERIEALGAKPAFLGYRGFPATVCASVNEEVVHGIPTAERLLNEGDIVSIDVGLCLNGFYSDTAVTVPVGQVDPERVRLLDVTREALEAGIGAAGPDRRMGDVSAAIQTCIEAAGFSVVRDYTGHGIGRAMHEEPHNIPNYGRPGTGMRLREGMVLALEPMANMGVWGTKVLEDGWTVVTQDGQPSAHFEHTVAITADGAEILTK